MQGKGTQQMDWSRAECLGVDPALFFPSKGESTRQAKETCARCPIREACLEHALVNGETRGVWGGTSERERRKLRRERGIKIRRGQCVVCGTSMISTGVVCSDECRDVRKQRLRPVGWPYQGSIPGAEHTSHQGDVA